MSLLLGIVLQFSSMPHLSSIPVDKGRLSAEIAADQTVIRSLKSNGDVSSIARPVDVRFVGQQVALRTLEADLRAANWTIVQTVRMDGGDHALDVQHVQTTDPQALRTLTETALRIERKYAVRYDGWGSVAQTGNTR